MDDASYQSELSWDGWQFATAEDVALLCERIAQLVVGASAVETVEVEIGVTQAGITRTARSADELRARADWVDLEIADHVRIEVNDWDLAAQSLSVEVRGGSLGRKGGDGAWDSGRRFCSPTRPCK